MSLLYQNDPRLPDCIQHYGCNLLATAALPQLFLWRFLSPEQVIQLKDWLVEENLVTGDMMLIEPETPGAIISKVGGMLGESRLRGEQVGSIAKGTVTFWGHVTEYTYDYAISRVRLYNGLQHFVTCDDNFRLLYNPHPRYTDYRIYEYLLYRLWLEG